MIRFSKPLGWHLCLLMLILLSGCSGLSVKDDWSRYYSAFNENKMLVCHGFGCKQQTQVELRGAVWVQIEQLFSKKGLSSQDERTKIAKAIVLMERFVGQHTGTWRDRAENFAMGQLGQMDCIDESTNTSAYLRLFAFRGWLQWHVVENRVMRSPFLVDVHWTAVIKDKHTQNRYAVDSWFKDNGDEPVIIELQTWLHKGE